MPTAMGFLGITAAPAALGVSALWLGSGAWLGRLVGKVMGKEKEIEN